VLADVVARLVPGVLPAAEAYEQESHWNGLLEYPHYTRPAVWRGREVPEIMVTGHHANIEAWRMEQSMKRTRRKRPDLWRRYLKKQRELAGNPPKIADLEK